MTNKYLETENPFVAYILYVNYYKKMDRNCDNYLSRFDFERQFFENNCAFNYKDNVIKLSKYMPKFFNYLLKTEIEKLNNPSRSSVEELSEIYKKINIVEYLKVERCQGMGKYKSFKDNLEEWIRRGFILKFIKEAEGRKWHLVGNGWEGPLEVPIYEREKIYVEMFLAKKKERKHLIETRKIDKASIIKK